MLQAINERITGWLGWIIIGLIIVTFALFGLGSYLQDKSRIYVAKVNDVEITPRELQFAYQQQRTQMEQALGDAFDPAAIDDVALRKRALESLIQRQLLLQQAEKQGLVISDQYLAALIHSIPQVQEDGTFSRQRYQQLLFNQGLTPAGFEQQTRDRLLVSQLVEGLTRTDFITEREILDAYRLQAQKRDFDYLIVSTQPYIDSAEVSDEAIQAYYDTHRDEFVAPERVKATYLRLRGEDLAADIKVDEQDIRSYYEEKKASLAKQEQRRASHILIQVAADADAATVKAARKKAEALLTRISAGEDFAELARKNSDDPASAAKGGDLGYFGKGVMAPAFEDTVFKMQPGQVSEVVKSPFGFHIIKLTDIRASEIPAYEEVRARLEKELKQRQADDLFYDHLEQLTNLAYENPDSLEPAATALGLKLRDSDWLTAAGGPGIGQYKKLLAAVFSDDVLEAGNNSEPVEVARNDVIVARIKEHQPAHPLSLAEVRDRIAARLAEQQARTKAKHKGEELLRQVEAGQSMEALQEKAYFAYRKADGVTRAAPGHNPQVVREVFTMAPPAPGAARTKGMVLANGDYAVLRLSAVHEADPKAMTEAEKTQLKRAFERMRQTLALNTLIEDLRARAEIEIPEQSQ